MIESLSEILTVAELIKIGSEKYSTNTFIRIENENDEMEELTYEAIAGITNKLHLFFESKNIKRGDRISVSFHNSGVLALLFLGIVASGRVLVPLNPNSTIFEMEYILDDSQSVFLFDGINIFDQLSSSIKERLGMLSLNSIAILLSILEPFAPGFDFLVKENTEAEIVYTSGTTGNPKGVLLMHKNLLADSYAIAKLFSFNASDRFLTITPLFHNSGQISTTLGAFWAGAVTTPVRAEFGLINFWSYIKKFGITWTLGMPTHINFLLEREMLKQNFRESDNTLKGIFCGGAKLETERQLQFETSFKTPVYTNYGLTETTSFATCTLPGESRSALGSVGKPLFINEIKIIVNGEFSETPYEEGEILIKGINLFKEYINKKEITDAKFWNDWFKSGDLGFFDKNRNLFIVDRIDNMILVGGENVYPADVENHLSCLEDVAEAVLTHIPHPILGNELVLVYRLNDGASPKPAAWLQALSKFVVKFKLPTKFVNVGELNLSEIPKAPNGKILRYNIKMLMKDFATKMN